MTPQQWDALWQCVADDGYSPQQCADLITYWAHGGP